MCRVVGGCLTTSGDVMPSIKLIEPGGFPSPRDRAVRIPLRHAEGDQWVPSGDEITLSGVPSPRDRAQHCDSTECQIRTICSRVSAACVSRLMFSRAELLKPPTPTIFTAIEQALPVDEEMDRLAAQALRKRASTRCIGFPKEEVRIDVAVHKHAIERALPAEDGDQQCACGANTPEGQHEFSVYCTSNWDPPTGPDIQVVPVERMRAELVRWQDEAAEDED